MGFLDFLFRRSKSTEAGESLYSGGDGSSIENAVIINCDKALEGVQAEYRYLASRLGKREVDWKPGSQVLLGGDDGMDYDAVDVVLADGTKRTFYFNVTNFLGKF